MTRLSVGIDLGTSSVRAGVITEAGDLITMARADYGSDAQSWRDPVCWWTAASTCLHTVIADLSQAGFDPADVHGIAIDGTSGSMVLTDESLAPVTRALMYNDGGLDVQAAQIAACAPNPHITRGSNSALARVLCLIAEDKDAKATHLLHQADFIAARLIGHGGHSDVNNALKTGVDPATGQWPDWMDQLALPLGLLPKAHVPGHPIAPISSENAKEFGLSHSVMVHAGTTDSIAAFLASAPAVTGSAVTSLGTTLAVKVMSPVRVDVPQMGLYSHRLGDGWLVGGASNTGGGVLKELFGDINLTALSEQIDPNIASPLDYYPLVRPGERFPVNDPTLQPRLTPRPIDDAAFLHGILESIARIERKAYSLIADHGGTFPAKIISAGGGASNPVWTKIRSRVLGIPVVEATTPEAAIGAAKLCQTQ
ncbi:FGGY-family carbohydrate kinase [Yoonia algicola]|uniref:FGGY-family carbohydrate kinase n=1 Tax=Yoonia algicola TaxID=3137368 RepID=A0AAN0M3X6_9RHOB